MRKFQVYAWAVLTLALIFPLALFAQAVVEGMSAAITIPAGPMPAEEIPLDVILNDLMRAFSNWKAMGWQAGVAGMITVILSTLKNSLLRAWLWDGIPAWAKSIVAPVLGIVLFALGLQEVSLKVVIAGITTGVAAVYIHQLLDGLKQAPWAGPKIKAAVDFIGKVLKKPAKQ